MYMINILKRKIKYKKHILIIFMTLIYILSNPFSVYAKDKVNIYFFNGEGCSYCEEFKSRVDTIKPEYGNLFELKDYDNAELLVARVLQQNPNDLDFLLFRAKILVEKKDYIRAV